ncbi:MAG: hypothetical protein AB7O62_19480 [Pirellulales bacterium]
MFPCCCPTDSSSHSSAALAECVSCLPGTTPASYQIDVVNMRDRFAVLCEECELLDGSYVVHPVGSCWYAVEFPPVCGYYRLELLVAPGAYYVTFIRLGGSPSTLGYDRLGLSFPRDCREHALPILATGGPGHCDHYASTVQITAL